MSPALLLIGIAQTGCWWAEDTTGTEETATEWKEDTETESSTGETDDTDPPDPYVVAGYTRLDELALSHPVLAGEREPEPEPTLRFALIGDFGTGDVNAAEVAALVQGWNVDFVMTVGDNNYPAGDAETIDANIGRDWHSYIHPYAGTYGTGADENRFWPCPGNHDWNFENEFKPYTDFFELPGNERYYEVIKGPVHLFCVNSDIHEPDTFDADGVQAGWLEAALAASTAPWRIVFQHHPPYSSGNYGPDVNRQWPFGSWGANLVLSGHEHDYERLVIDGLTHVISGTGGIATRSVGTFLEGSQAFWTDRHGAVLVELSENWGRFASIDTLGALGDVWYDAPGVDRTKSILLFKAESTWHYLPGPLETPVEWTVADHDDQDWETAQAPIGVGTNVNTELENASAVQTIYMRSSFALTRSSEVLYLVMRLRRDDGAVVYLNGEEIYRVGMLEGETPGTSTPAAFAVEGEWEEVYAETLVWPTHLQDGRNQLALEVHRASDGDGDLFADLELAAILR